MLPYVRNLGDLQVLRRRPRCCGARSTVLWLGSSSAATCMEGHPCEGHTTDAVGGEKMYRWNVCIALRMCHHSSIGTLHKVIGFGVIASKGSSSNIVAHYHFA